MTAEILHFPARPTVFLADAPPDLPWRRSPKYNETLIMLRRALRVCTMGRDIQAAGRSREFMRHVQELSEYPQAQTLAKVFIKIADQRMWP